MGVNSLVRGRLQTVLIQRNFVAFNRQSSLRKYRSMKSPL
jgi:hypothetical protein